MVILCLENVCFIFVIFTIYVQIKYPVLESFNIFADIGFLITQYSPSWNLLSSNVFCSLAQDSKLSNFLHVSAPDSPLQMFSVIPTSGISVNRSFLCMWDISFGTEHKRR